MLSRHFILRLLNISVCQNLIGLDRLYYLSFDVTDFLLFTVDLNYVRILVQICTDAFEPDKLFVMYEDSVSRDVACLHTTLDEIVNYF